MNRWLSAFALCLLLLIAAAVVSAQSEATPTAAPSKTPSAASEALPSATPAAASVSFPLTQADLVRLTANVQRPNGLGWFESKLYTACTGDGTVYEIDDTTGATRTYIYGIRNAHTLHVEEDANGGIVLWVPDYGANTLAQVTRNGVRTIISGLRGPWGIVALDESRFLLTNLLGNTLNVVDRAGTNTVAVPDLAAPTGLFVDEDIVYVANTGSTRRAIEWYPLEDVVSGEFERTDAVSQVLVSGLQNTTGVQLGSDGFLYFAYALGTRGVVGRVDPEACREAGGCTNEQVEIVLYTDLAAPLAGLVVTPDLRLFVHEMFSPDMYWLSLVG
ncbi:MAG: hypothetical protein IPK19_32610 [Chloroflexi bacterium]|nr:hypothetical protein [Chloroflexota bacterium]